MRIEIQTDADFTPKGKRTVRIVEHHKSGKKMRPAIAWYVGRNLYRYLALTSGNLALSREWFAA
jgi:hypothetical protein